MPIADLYRDTGLARFYDLANGWDADFDFCMRLAQDVTSVLDLGCGTGELAVALAAEGKAVTGVDPAGAMLDVARGRTGAEKVTWVEADAASVRLGARFDLIVMTGHTFQVFLTTAAQRSALATIAAHLAPTGRFIFDSRNPGFPAPKERRREETLRLVEHPHLGQILTWNESTYDERTGVLTYENEYRVESSGQEAAATAQIRYTTQSELAVLIKKAGLEVDEWLGDWNGGPYHPTAREIIPIGCLSPGR